jgi:hypothetical protein
MAQEFIKVVLTDDRSIMVPSENMENFRRIFFNQIADVIYPDAKGNYRETKKVIVNALDVTKVVESYKAENEALAEENEILKATIESINSTVDTVAEKAKKSKTKTK